MNTLATLTLSLAIAALSGQSMAAGDPAAGKDKSAACAACHGADGNSSDPQYPRLAGQYENYLVHSLQAYKSGARKNPIMSGFAAGLSEQDMKDLAAYFSAQDGVHVTAVGRVLDK